MRKLLLMFAVTLCRTTPIAAQEQGPLSLSAAGYLGTNSAESTGHSLQLKAAYHVGKFSISLGVSHFSSGVSIRNSPVDTYPYTYDELTLTHLMLPLALNYHAPMGNKFEFIPSIGLGISYNTGAKYMTSSSDSSFYQKKFSNEEFNEIFRKVSIWSSGAVHFSYRLSEHLALLAGSEFQIMLSNKFKPNAGIGNEHPLTLFFGLGARYRF
jgi:hypothetical protein